MGKIEIQRTKGWQKRLTAYVDAQRATPFRPGRMDCALFAAGAVEAMTGVDLARGWRGYRTLRAGLKRLEEEGIGDHIELAAEHLREIPDPRRLGPGDVAVIRQGEELVLGIVQGRYVYVAGPRGVALHERSEIVRGFLV